MSDHTAKFPGLAAALLCLAVLSGCEDLPQPFRHVGPPPPLTHPVETRAIAVEPVDDSPSAKAMAAALVKALTAREIPADVGPALPGSLRLHGTADASAGQVALALVLDGLDHRPQSATRLVVPAAVWQDSTPKLLAPLAARAVAALVGEVAAVPAAAGAPAAAHRPTVRLQAPADLPGDGGAALTRAMRNALERSGILVVGEGGDYVVEAKVTVTPTHPGEQTLAVAWVVHGGDGKTLATISQTGGVASGRLEQPWGELARQIAEGGAAGVAQVLERSGAAP